MSREHPETHVQFIPGTADFDGAESGQAAAIGVERETGNLVFHSRAGTRKVVDNFSDQTVAGNKNLTGTTTFTGPQTFTGDATFNGSINGARGGVSVTSADTIAVGASASNTTYIATKGSATQVFTLPAAATPGLIYSFVCAHASGEIHVGVQEGDNIIGKTHGAENGTGILSTATTGLLKNTAASNVVGDFCTLVSDGVTTWYMVAVAGVWSAT
jgi:hypothetical protein